MSRNQSSIRSLPKYGLRAFCAATSLAIPAAHPRFLEPAVRRVVLNGQVMKLPLSLVSTGHLQSEIESGSVIGL
jgi:hypothetical protein